MKKNTLLNKVFFSFFIQKKLKKLKKRGVLDIYLRLLLKLFLFNRSGIHNNHLQILANNNQEHQEHQALVDEKDIQERKNFESYE